MNDKRASFKEATNPEAFKASVEFACETSANFTDTISSSIGVFLSSCFFPQLINNEMIKKESIDIFFMFKVFMVVCILLRTRKVVLLVTLYLFKIYTKMSDRLLQSKINLLQSDELKRYLSLYVDFLLTKQYEKPTEKKRVPVFGSAKGAFKISANFNEPLDDFYN